MLIKGLQKTTLIDYPGKVACTVFLAGCNFRCPWCYAPHLVLPEKIKRQPTVSEKDFFKFLKERKGLLDGVCVCGGEPTIHKELPDFISRIKKTGYLVKLDTNGSNPEMLKSLIEAKLFDYIAMDIKVPLESNLKAKPNSQISKYEVVTGIKIGLDKIRESIQVIKNSGIDYEFRTTVIPGVHTKEDIIQIAKDISPAKKYCLQFFRSEETVNSKFKKRKPCSRDFISEILKEISRLFEICEARG
jgi:pyruvate formate lyase activating enzyme